MTVSDNGVGVALQDAERKANESSEENKGDTGEKSRHGYAMRNIVHRLQLYYGAEADLRMSSIPGEGTTVEIILPIHEEGQEDAGY
ncbi:hypothetical protein D3C73_1510920 [compost metagenome]